MQKIAISYEPLNAVLHCSFYLKSLACFFALVSSGNSLTLVLLLFCLVTAVLFSSKDKDHFPMRLWADVVYVKTPVGKEKEKEKKTVMCALSLA